MNNFEKSLLVSNLQKEKKSKATAWLLFLFLGSFGAHNFYLKRTPWAISELGCFLLIIPTLGISAIPLLILYIVDLFTINKTVDNTNTEIDAKIAATIAD